MALIWDKIKQAEEVEKLVMSGKAKTVQEALEIVKAQSVPNQSNRKSMNKHSQIL